MEAMLEELGEEEEIVEYLFLHRIFKLKVRFYNHEPQMCPAIQIALLFRLYGLGPPKL
jgi:hypothetical protein